MQLSQRLRPIINPVLLALRSFVWPPVDCFVRRRPCALSLLAFLASSRRG